IGLQPGGRDGAGGSVGWVPGAGGGVALGALVGLLLLRGVSGVLSEPRRDGSPAANSSNVTDPATAAFAVGFARAYLTDASPQALASYLAPGISAPASAGTGTVAQVEHAEVAAVPDLGGPRAIVTVP